MGLALPKQYAELAGKPMIARSVETLLAVERIERVFVVLAPDDEHWGQYCGALLDPRLTVLKVGGATRGESVRNGLASMASGGFGVGADDWGLVHDAARACLTVQLVERLMAEVGEGEVGGLLAVPVADTLKRANEAGTVTETVPRDGLWQAQTPQMFRIGLLREALARSTEVTDESSAVEALGYAPRLVRSNSTNFKVTRAEDLALAERVLKDRVVG
jgi:2-C-methyl-D-erythritol 4-phosphate cytidylyltransferase